MHALQTYFANRCRVQRSIPTIRRSGGWNSQEFTNYLVVEGSAACRAGVAAGGGGVVHDPLVDEEAAAQLEQLSAGGADVAVVAVRRRQVRLVVVQGAARGELQGWMDAWL